MNTRRRLFSFFFRLLAYFSSRLCAFSSLSSLSSISLTPVKACLLLLATFFVVSCFLLFFFWQVLLGNLILMGANQYCLHCFGSPLESEGIHRDPLSKSWVIDKPRIAPLNATLKGDSLRFYWTIFPFNQETAMRLEVVGSRIEIGAQEADLSVLIKKLIPKNAPYWFFNFNSQFELNDGVIVWRDLKRGSESAYFQVSVFSSQEKKSADLALFLENNPDSTENVFHFHVSQEENQPLEAILTFRQVDAGRMFRMFDAMGNPLGETIGGSFKGWNVLTGEMNGSLSLFIPNDWNQPSFSPTVSSSFHLTPPPSSPLSSPFPYALGKATIKGLSIENPHAKIAGGIEEFVIDLQVDHLDKKKWKRVGPHFPEVTGRLEIIKGGSLFFLRNGAPFWKIEELKGGIFFKPDQKLYLDLNGNCACQQDHFVLKIEGEGEWQENEGVLLETALYLSAPNQEKASLYLSAKPLGLERHAAEVRLQNFGPKELNFFQGIAGRCFSQLDQLQIHKGHLDASGVALFKRFHLEEFRCDQIEAHTLNFEADCGITCSVEKISGKGSIDFLKEDVIQGVEADLSLLHASFVAFSSSEVPLCFEEVSTHLSLKDGTIQKSEIQGKLGRLQGTIGIDWKPKGPLLQLSFFGPAEEIALFFPTFLRHKAEWTLAEEQLLLKAEVSWEQEGAQVKGEVHFSGDNPVTEEVLSFGFHLEKSSKKFWKKWPADDLVLAYWKEAGSEVLHSVLPPIASPAALLESNWIRSELGFEGIVLRKGWFSAHSVPLEKYLAPFLFRKQEMGLSGVGSFQGHFDHHQLAVSYEVKEALLENAYLAMIADTIEGSHYFNFEKRTHFGSLPLKNVTYLEKTNGVHFLDTEASVMFVNNCIHLQRIETQCGGMAFSGEIDIDFGLPDDGIFDIEIRTSCVKGALSQLQELCHTIDPNLWALRFPLEAEFLLQGDGGKLHLSFSPEGCAAEADMVGSIAKGTLFLDEVGLRLEDIGLQFAYHFNPQGSQWEASQISAFIRPQDSFSSEEGYHLEGDHFRLSSEKKELGRPRASFDFWVGDRSRDLVRLTGSAEPEGESIVVKVNPEKTHLGHVHPTYFQLLFKDSLELEQFKMVCDLNISHLCDIFIPSDWLTMGALLQAGSYALSNEAKNKDFSAYRKWGKEMSALKKARGEIHLDLSYQGSGRELGYHLTGEHLALGEHTVTDCELFGTYQDAVWTIERCVVDGKKMSGIVSRCASYWEIGDGLFDDGQAMHIHFDGKIEDNKNLLHARVHNIEVDLAHLKGTPEIEQCVSGCSPHGILKGSGEMKCQWGKEYPRGRVEAILDVGFSSWDVKGIHFQDVKNVSCHFVSDRGATLRKLNTSLIDPELKNAFAAIQAEKMYCEFATGEMAFDDFHFQVHAHHLPRFAEQMKMSFPDFFAPALVEAVSNAKMEGNMEGTMTFEMTPPYSAVKLVLKEGRYHFLNAEHDLSQFVMESDPFEFKVASRYLLGDRWVWLHARSFSPILERGDLVITESDPDKAPSDRLQESLYIKWENDPKTGLSISTAEGTYQGLNVRFKRDPDSPLSEEEMILVGTVAIDARKAKGFFPQAMEEKLVDWQVGAGYWLRGQWRFKKKGGVSDYSSRLHFLGMLEGEQFSLKGYQFDSLTAQLEYTPSLVQMRELKVSDLAGELRVEQADFIRHENGEWEVKVPETTVSFFSPSLLREAGMPRPSVRKPLVVKKLILNDVQGPLSSSIALQGQGELHFTNRSKKLLQNTIFQIPSDLLSRIGLDLSVLTPVVGTIQYEIRDGKIYLTKFKDVYSEGKLSKFYLPGAVSPSYLDFDGKLHVQVKMRQHNLLFKLAELFAVNIQGDLAKPVYSLNKQKWGEKRRERERERLRGRERERENERMGMRVPSR